MSNHNISDDYHINTAYQQPQPQILPKLRPSTGGSGPQRKPPTAVPATPRMLRNSSGNFTPTLSSGQNKQQHQRQPSSSSNSSSSRHVPMDSLSSPQRSVSDASTRRPPQFRDHLQSPLEGKFTSKPTSAQQPQQNNSPTRLPPLDTHLTPQQQNPSEQSSTPTRLLPPATVEQPKDAVSTPSRSAQSHSPTQAKKTHQQAQFHRRSIGEWDFIKTIGAGSMGKVKLAKHRQTNEICAIKIVPRAARMYSRSHANDAPPNNSQELLARQKEYEKEVTRDKRTIREASLGRILYHPFICRLFEVKTMSNHYYMLFEYVSGGQMLDYIVSHGSLKERHARKFARGIASALDYLHRNNVVHRDLKIENIMISKSGDIKIIDFGLSNMYSLDALLKTYCGSLYFAAPELLSAHPYIGPEVDVWSFGVVLYVLVCGKVPFDDQSVSVLHEKIKKGKVEYPDFLSNDVISLLSRMLVVNPNKRARLSEVMTHPWLTKGFEGAPISFVPLRTPLKLPLDPVVIEEIVRLEFGVSEDQVLEDIQLIIKSKQYQDATRAWNASKNPSDAQRMIVDPTSGFHPLVSIYYLVDEMLKRKKAKESIVDIPSAIPDTQTTQSSTTQIKAPEPYSTPTPPPQLTFPEAAHTSPTYQTPPIVVTQPDQITSSPTGAATEGIIQQQHTKVRDHNTDPQSKGLNSLLRKFSQRRSHSTRRPSEQAQLSTTPMTPDSHHLHPHSNTVPHSNTININSQDDPQAALVRRVGSMKLTRKAPFEEASQPQTTTNRTHNRTVSAYAGPTPAHSLNEKAPPLPTQVQTSTQRKYHPTARAKSVGHGRRENTFGAADAAKNHTQVPPLPADINDEGFFDDITLDDYNSGNDKVTLVGSQTSGGHGLRHPYTNIEMNETQIMEEAAKAPPGSMPSIEYPRSLFLKGFFSVQTTSTKPLPVIRADIISVLSKLGVAFSEVRGGFVCVHTPSIQDSKIAAAESLNDKSPTEQLTEEEGKSLKSNKSSNESSTEASKVHTSNTETSFNESFNDQQSTPSSSSKAHRRKFSIGGSILGRRKPSITPMIPPTPVAANAYNSNTLTSPVARNHGSEFDSSASLDSLNNGGHGGSDMLVSSRLEQNKMRQPSNSMGATLTEANETGNGEGFSNASQSISQSRTPLKFEIHIVKVPLVGLFGVHLKKVMGNTWMYKTLAGQILHELNL